MPFPLRTAPVPKSSKIGFPWCQGPSAAHSQLSQECFQRGCWTLTNTAMHHPCPPPPPRCSPELRAGTEAPPSHESSTETCSAPLTLGATQRKQGTYFLTLEQAAILHWAIFHSSALIPQIRLLNPASAMVCPGPPLQTIHTALPVPKEMSEKLCAIFLLSVWNYSAVHVKWPLWSSVNSLMKKRIQRNSFISLGYGTQSWR